MLPQKHKWEVPGGVIIAENYYYLVIIMIKISNPKVMPDQKKVKKEIWKREETNFFFSIIKYFKFLRSVLNQKSMEKFILWRNSSQSTTWRRAKHIID